MAIMATLSLKAQRWYWSQVVCSLEVRVTHRSGTVLTIPPHPHKKSRHTTVLQVTGYAFRSGQMNLSLACIAFQGCRLAKCLEGTRTWQELRRKGRGLLLGLQGYAATCVCCRENPTRHESDTGSLLSL